MSENILIFTKKVLPRSLTFVASQGSFLPTLNPIFVGFQRDPSGTYLVKSSDVRLLEEYSRNIVLNKFLLETVGYVNNCWLESMRVLHPKLVHAHFGKGGFYSVPIANKLEIPLAVTFHGSDITQKDRFSYNDKHRRAVFEHANIIFASSRFIYEKLVKRGCPPDKICIHYIGVDTSFFKPCGPKALVPTIAFVGRLIKQKGCHFLIDAAKKLQLEIPELKIIVAGSGVESKRLKRQAEAIRNIEFIGSVTQSQVREVLQKSWILCAPSTRTDRGNEEGLGMVFLEAQAMETPVVSFNTGGVSEAVKDGDTGVLVNDLDTAELAATLKHLLLDSTYRTALGKEGRRHVTRNFNSRSQASSIESILRILF